MKVKIKWMSKCDNKRASQRVLKPEFTIVIFIHYKPRIAVAILAL